MCESRCRAFGGPRLEAREETQRRTALRQDSAVQSTGRGRCLSRKAHALCRYLSRATLQVFCRRVTPSDHIEMHCGGDSPAVPFVFLYVQRSSMSGLILKLYASWISIEPGLLCSPSVFT